MHLSGISFRCRHLGLYSGVAGCVHFWYYQTFLNVWIHLHFHVLWMSISISPTYLTIFGIGQTFQILQIQWVGNGNCCFNLLVIFYFWHGLRLIEMPSVPTAPECSVSQELHHTLSSPECLKQTRRWAGQGPGCGRLFMLPGWWLLLCPHPVSLQDCKAIINIDPNFLKCRLHSIYWLGTFKSHSSWWACGVQNASSQRPLAENILLLMSLKSLCQVGIVTK